MLPIFSFSELFEKLNSFPTEAYDEIATFLRWAHLGDDKGLEPATQETDTVNETGPIDQQTK